MQKRSKRDKAVKLIKPIRNEADYLEALEVLDKHFDASAETADGDFVEVLSILIEDYERKNFPISLPDPIEAILFHLESYGLKRKYLEQFIGSSGRVSEILNKKRPLTMEMIRNLHSGLGISLEVLLQKYMDEPETGIHRAVKKWDNQLLENYIGMGVDWAVPTEHSAMRFPDARIVIKANSAIFTKPVTRATYN